MCTSILKYEHTVSQLYLDSFMYPKINICMLIGPILETFVLQYSKHIFVLQYRYPYCTLMCLLFWREQI
jgi:hypothetical protein